MTRAPRRNLTKPGSGRMSVAARAALSQPEGKALETLDRALESEAQFGMVALRAAQGAARSSARGGGATQSTQPKRSLTEPLVSPVTDLLKFSV